MTPSETFVNWEHFYRPPNRLKWRGRYDGPEARRFHEVTQCIDLRERPRLRSTFHSYAIIGFCCDEGIHRNQGRPGAAQGPAHCRGSLSNIPVDKVDDFILYDLGDIHCVEHLLEDAQLALAHVVSWTLDHGIKPIVIGGGHETAYGHYLGVANSYPHANMAIINFDAHFDLRPLLDGNLGSSGTPFTQIANHRHQKHLNFNYFCIGIQQFGNTPSLFRKAKELGVQYITAGDIHLHGPKKADEMLQHILETHETIFVSLDMDVFAAAYAPGVSATQPLGLTPWQVIPLLRKLSRSGRVVSAEVVELSPEYDRDDITAQLSAGLIAEYIHGLA